MRHTLLIAFIAVLFVQCGGDSKESGSGKDTATATADAVLVSPAEGEDAEANEYAVCIWEKVIIRETPEDKGKYVTTVNLAEKLSLTGESKIDESTAKKREYVKVKLMDGKEGWGERFYFG